MALDIDVNQGDYGTYKLKLSGSLDSETHTQLDQALEPAWEDGEARAIVLEMQDLRFISSMGLGSIVKARRSIEAKGGVLVVIGAQPQVKKVFDIVRMLPDEQVFASREEADDYFARIQQRVLEGEGEPGPAVA